MRWTPLPHANASPEEAPSLDVEQQMNDFGHQVDTCMPRGTLLSRRTSYAARPAKPVYASPNKENIGNELPARMSSWMRGVSSRPTFGSEPSEGSGATVEPRSPGHERAFFAVPFHEAANGTCDSASPINVQQGNANSKQVAIESEETQKEQQGSHNHPTKADSQGEDPIGVAGQAATCCCYRLLCSDTVHVR